MSDIVIYTNEKVLLHKQDKLEDDDDKSEDGQYFWEFGRPPKEIDEVKKIYFAVKGRVLGYFVVLNAFSDLIEWKSDTWTPIESIECKPFRGFRYVWWDVSPPKASEAKEGKT